MAFSISEQKGFLKPSPADRVREPTHRFGTVFQLRVTVDIFYFNVLFFSTVVTDNRTDSQIQISTAWVHYAKIKRSNGNGERWGLP